MLPVRHPAVHAASVLSGCGRAQLAIWSPSVAATSSPPLAGWLQCCLHTAGCLHHWGVRRCAAAAGSPVCEQVKLNFGGAKKHGGGMQVGRGGWKGTANAAGYEADGPWAVWQARRGPCRAMQPADWRAGGWLGRATVTAGRPAQRPAAAPQRWSRRRRQRGGPGWEGAQCRRGLRRRREGEG